MLRDVTAGLFIVGVIFCANALIYGAFLALYSFWQMVGVM